MSSQPSNSTTSRRQLTPLLSGLPGTLDSLLGNGGGVGGGGGGPTNFEPTGLPPDSKATGDSNKLPPDSKATPGSDPNSSNPTNPPASGASPSPTPTTPPGKSPPANATSTDSPTPSPSPSPSPLPAANTPTNSTSTPTTTPPKPENTPVPTIPTNSSKGPNVPEISTITTTINAPNIAPTSTPPKRLPPPAQSAQPESSGLSGGAITGIAVVAGIIGFVLLFWVGVQMLQSKRKRREEAEMQEIDFNPSGNGSINGDNLFPRPSAALNRQAPMGETNNTMNYHKGAAYNEPHYGDDLRIHDGAEYIDPINNANNNNSEYENGLQRNGTLGGSSAYSNGSAGPHPYYSNQPSMSPAPYSHYSPYAGQYGAQSTQARYEPAAAPSTVPVFEYGHGPPH